MSFPTYTLIFSFLVLPLYFLIFAFCTLESIHLAARLVVVNIGLGYSQFTRYFFPLYFYFYIYCGKIIFRNDKNNESVGGKYFEYGIYKVQETINKVEEKVQGVED